MSIPSLDSDSLMYLLIIIILAKASCTVMPTTRQKQTPPFHISWRGNGRELSQCCHQQQAKYNIENKEKWAPDDFYPLWKLILWLFRPPRLVWLCAIPEGPLTHKNVNRAVFLYLHMVCSSQGNTKSKSISEMKTRIYFMTPLCQTNKHKLKRLPFSK